MSTLTIGPCVAVQLASVTMFVSVASVLSMLSRASAIGVPTFTVRWLYQPLPSEIPMALGPPAFRHAVTSHVSVRGAQEKKKKRKKERKKRGKKEGKGKVIVRHIFLLQAES